MKGNFNKLSLSSAQKRRIKALYARNNYRGLFSILESIAWIGLGVVASQMWGLAGWIIAMVIIGTRQRALASLLHEAAHGTLFKAKVLNSTVGRVVCGWTILQSFDSYRKSHVLAHHPHISDAQQDPDYSYMLEAGVYANQSRAAFIWKFLITPALGRLTPHYIGYLLRERLGKALQTPKERGEVLCILAFHTAILAASHYAGVMTEVVLLWFVPFVVVYPLVGWYSELAEHFPMMDARYARHSFFSRNRYAGRIEKLFIGMHGDHYHLTHHLLPGLPHWNLGKATEILREDDAFRAWDDHWGGIFSSAQGKVSLLAYLLNEHPFELPDSPIFAEARP
ncbi:fatty acid desaturase family protein [Pseudomonas sp. NPDC089401]|uniref:fatty acid desaturase family protein n=1 Tax=Pseudomonas sp. NPDC089401 TaxID=3364462 RepID=UPI0037F2C44F